MLSRVLVALALASLVPACSSGDGGGSPADTRGGGDVSFGGDAAGVDVQNPAPTCQIQADCPAATPYCSPTGLCLECLADGHCGDGRCAAGLCVAASCTPGEGTCNGDVALTCRPDGAGWDTLECPPGGCVDGACTGCTPGERVCNGQTALACRGDGGGYDPVQVCQEDQVCVEGSCMMCYPGARRCGAAGQAEVCSPAGAWGVIEDCAAQGLNCLQGACISPCVNDIKGKSNSGCDYWAVDLDNHWDAQDGAYAIIVSNPSDRSATITVSKRDGPAAEVDVVDTRVVVPSGLEIIELPQRNMSGVGFFWTAYRVQSTAPIIAYQFNPLDNIDVFSNDASLLLPANTYGTEYIAMSRFELLGGGPNGTSTPYRGTLSVVAIAAATDVTIRPTARTLAGPSMQTMLPGQSYTYTLEPYQVLNIKSDQNAGDLTGTIITATREVAVFGGHEAAVTSTVCCADHLEQQLFPVHTWGQTYVAARSFQRLMEPDYWRVVAAADGTVVTTAPQVTNPRTLARGEWFEFTADGDFMITADKPIMVAQILASSGEVVSPPAYSSCTSNFGCHPLYQCLPANVLENICVPPACTPGVTACMAGHACACFSANECRCSAIGDPSLILVPPVGQFRDEYVFLTPNKYADDYINIIAPAGASVTLNGLTVPAGNFEAISGSTWRVSRLKVPDGVHRLTATEPVGVIVYGYDRDVSYGYPAGLNLTDL